MNLFVAALYLMSKSTFTLIEQPSKGCFIFVGGTDGVSEESRAESRVTEADSRPVEGAVAAVVLVGEERALDKDT